VSGILPIGIGSAALFALLMSGRKGKKADDSSSGGTVPGGRRDPWLQPIWVPTGPNGDNRIREEICRQTDPSKTVLTPVLAESVWKVIWQGVPWPVQANDHASVLQAKAILDALIAEYLQNPIAFCEQFEGDEDKPGEPQPIDITLFEDAYPNDGLMYQVVYGDILGGTDSDRSVAYRALLSAGYKAATQVLGLDHEAAASFALTLAKNQAARAIYVRMIQCDDLFNALYYTTEGFDSNITSGHKNADGRTRALRFLKLHPDNRNRLKNGLAPMRSIDRVTGSGPSGKLEYLHLPLLDPEALANASLPLDDRIVPGVWDDGTSGLLPPPPIQRLINLSVLPKGVYGCKQPNVITV
jgi:hypothetical protein